MASASVGAGSAGAGSSWTFWNDVEYFLRGTIHREAATNAESVLALPTSATFLAKYPLKNVLSEVGAVLEASAAVADDGEEGEEDDDEAFLLYPRGVKADARKKLVAGCELLEKLFGSAAVFLSASSSVEELFAVVAAAARSAAGCLRRVAAAFFRRVAEQSFVHEGSDSTSAEPITKARSLLWSSSGSEPSFLRSLIELFADKDVVTAQRATMAIVALLMPTSPSAADKSSAVAGAGATAASTSESAVTGTCDDSQLSIFTEAMDSTLIGSGEGDDESPYLADASIRVVRLAALLTAFAEKGKGGPASLAAADRIVSSFVKSGLMEVVLDAASQESYEEDPLSLLAVLEYLPFIASVPSGAKAVLEGVLVTKAPQSLLHWSGVASADGEGDSFLGPSALSALAQLYFALKRQHLQAGAAGIIISDADLVAAMLSALFDRCVPGVFRAAAKACESGQPIEKSARATNACCVFLASGDEALRAFLAAENTPYAREWLENGLSSSAELRCAALGGVALIFEKAASAATSSLSSSSTAGGSTTFPLHLELFNRFASCCGREVGEVALTALKKPDVESRLAAYQLLAAICSLPASDAWNLRRVWGASGLATHLLDRTTEHEKDGKDAKFTVVEATMKNPFKAGLGDFFLTQLRTYYAQGPYYKPVGAARVELAT